MGIVTVYFDVPVCLPDPVGYTQPFKKHCSAVLCRRWCLPVTVCNCWRSNLRHCWCSVVKQFSSSRCCLWHTVKVPSRT